MTVLLKEPQIPVEVQWYGRASSGVRSWKLHGVTLVHLRLPESSRTLCGRRVARPSKRTFPVPADRRCKPCQQKRSAT